MSVFGKAGFTFLGIAISVLIAIEAAGQIPVEEREWVDLSGKFKVVAKLEKVDVETAHLLKTDGSAAAVPVSRLSKNDQEYVEAWNQIKSSLEQVNKTESLLPGLATEPIATVEVFTKMHWDDGGITAGLIAASILAADGGPKRFEDAERILDETIFRLRLVAKHFPSVHQNTLISALNNRAVLSLRSLNGAKAVTFLREASKITDEIAFVVHHNSATLLAVTAEDSFLRLSTGSKLQLREIAESQSEVLSGITPPNRFLYSTKYDVSQPPATTSVPTDRLGALRAVGLWPELTCLLCAGTGFKDCPTCARGVVNVKTREVVGINPLNKQPIFGTVSNTVKCQNCNGKGGFKCPACRDGRLPFDG